MPNLVGIGLSQVPTNGMLGGLAYQDPEHASIKDLDLKNLSQINSEISDTATDIFVYDTRKDSDGGAWRKRTQHTSWYNETLGTATRGTRREFPAVAVIVAEQNFIKIYDGDDPDLPMWMVFNTIAGGNSQGMADRPMIQVQNTDKVVYALNGILATGTKNEGSNYGQPIINFISEKVLRMDSEGGEGGEWIGTIAQRNEAIGYRSVDYDYVIAASRVNDIAMKVLPNAPIDDATGLPVPTIAVATDGGVSVIKDDGSVVDIRRTSDDDVHHVAFDGNRVIMFMELGAIYVATIPSADQSGNPNSAWTVYGSYGGNTSGTDHPAVQAYGSGIDLVSMKDHTFATAGFNDSNDQYKGLSILSENLESSGNGMVAWIRSDCNTGYMHGDIRGAFLSDTTTESLTANTNLASNFVQGGTNRLTSETYDNGDTSWQMVDNAGTANGYVSIELRGLTVGQSYIISMTWDNNATLDAGYNHRIAHLNGQAGENATNFTHWNKTNGSSETLTGIFVAQSANNDDLVFYANGITLNITNFNVRAVDDEDRSLNNKGLQVYGTVTKSAVATGADLVAYSGNGTSNYLEQPYNPSLNFGANSEFSVMGWMYNTNVGGGQYIFDRSVTYGSSRDWQLWVAADLKYINMYIAGGQTVTSGNNAFENNAWFQFAVVRSGGFAKIYINGVEKASTASTLSTIPASNVPMKVLFNCNQNTKLSLFRISATAASPEQIKKMYEDEKMLFQENAKATLYGSSDAVTALAYDDSTNLLYAGTSSGRSEFQGLRRINNTTEAVTTAISASNGLVAEQ